MLIFPDWSFWCLCLSQIGRDGAFDIPSTPATELDSTAETPPPPPPPRARQSKPAVAAPAAANPAADAPKTVDTASAANWDRVSTPAYTLDEIVLDTGRRVLELTTELRGVGAEELSVRVDAEGRQVLVAERGTGTLWLSCSLPCSVEALSCQSWFEASSGQLIVRAAAAAA